MRFIAAAVLAAPFLRIGCLANPFPLLRRYGDSYDRLNSSHSLCDSHESSGLDSSAGTRSVIWHQTEAGVYLDWWLHVHGRLDWPTNLQISIGQSFPSDESDGGVSTETCDQFVDADAGPAYYALLAANRVGTMLATLQNALNDGTVIYNTGTYPILSTLVSDWRVSDDSSIVPTDTMFAGRLANAFMAGIGQVDAGYHLPLMGIVGSTFGAASLVSNEVDQAPDYATVARRMQGLYASVAAQIDITHDTMLSDSGEPSMLAGVGWGSDRNEYVTDIAKFFATGRFLLGDPDGLMNDFLDQAYGNARLAILIAALIEKGYVLFWNTGDHNCGDNYLDTEVDEEGETRCINLMNISADYTGAAIGEYPWEGFGDFLTEYGLDLTTLWQNAEECLRYEGDGMDYDQLKESNDLLPCFYQFPIMAGSIDWQITNVVYDCRVNSSPYICPPGVPLLPF